MITGSIMMGQINVSYVAIVTILVSVAIMVMLWFVVNKTKAGKAMRAVSEDMGAAQLMGINVNNTISLTFAIGSGLAAVASVLLCSTYPQISPYTGAMPGIKAFVAAVLGGIGSIPGAMIGGIVLGIIEILSRTYISSQLADAIVFGILVVVLVVYFPNRLTCKLFKFSVDLLGIVPSADSAVYHFGYLRFDFVILM